MKDVEVYGKLLEEFIRKVTSPEIGQFRLEVSTFRIILERERKTNPILNRFSISETGTTTNNLNDKDESLLALQVVLQRSLDFLSSLVGEELARDLVMSSMQDSIKDLASHVKESPRLLRFIPPPFNDLLKDMVMGGPQATDHDEVLELFQDIFGSYMKDLSAQTDLSALKLKLNILREKHRLLRHVEVKKNNTIVFDKEKWANAPDEEVREALVEAFNSMVGLSVFLVGKEEAMKKASRSLEYYFESKEHLIKRYRIRDHIVNGSLSRRISTGIDELDHRMHGGIPKGCSLLLNAPSGIERDVFVSRMMTVGLNGSSSILMVLSKEPPRSVRMLLRAQGLDPEAMEEEGRLRLIDWFSWRGERIIGVEKEGYTLKSSKILSNLGIAINKGLRELTFTGSKIGIIHMIGPALNIFDLNQVYNFVQRLRAKFKEDEMASIFILEPETFSDEQGKRLMEVFDGQIELSKRMVDGTFKREISVKALSGSDFDSTPIPFIVKDNMLHFAGSEPTPPSPLPEVVHTPLKQERRKTMVNARRAPSEPVGQIIREDAFEDIDDDAWLNELLEEGAADVPETVPEVRPLAIKVSEVIVEVPEPPPAENEDDGPLEGQNKVPVKPIIKGRKLSKKGKGRSSEALTGVIKERKALRASGPPPVRPRRVRKALGKDMPRRSPPDPAALMDEIDITGTQNSPQKLLLDAIETIDQLLEESEISVPKDPHAPQKAQKKRP
ncbi:MAG: RAD55 family ATPase [Candidatus Thermoplasmatota archaeon]|nr:RAD55 family ATPase [Candidatus Thermoplasmatota archaeon]